MTKCIIMECTSEGIQFHLNFVGSITNGHCGLDMGMEMYMMENGGRTKNMVMGHIPIRKNLHVFALANVVKYVLQL